MTHILVISQYFYPEQFRINDICKEWVKRGYKVTVITGIPNYPEGKFYKGFGFFKKKVDNYAGVQIIRLPLVPRGSTSGMLALNYLSFVISGRIWSIFTKIKADYVFIFEVSPMTQALPGIWYAKKKRIPCYLYVQDLWPDNVEIVTGIRNRYIIGGLNHMVNYIYRQCTHIFVTSHSFENELIKRGVGKQTVTYWPQYAENFYIPSAQKKEKKGIYKIIFTGNIGYAQGLDILPKVAELLKNDDIKFILVGDGRYKDSLQNEILKRQVSDMFEFIKKCPPEEIPNYLASADAAFLSFMNNPLFEKTIPAKLQSYMACGMPVIAAACGETKQIIEEANCGMCASLGNINELADIIRNIRTKEQQKMSENALLYYKENFDKETLLESMDLYFGR